MKSDFNLISLNDYSFSIYWKGNCYSYSKNNTNSDIEELKYQIIQDRIIPKVEKSYSFTEDDENFLYLLTDFDNWLHNFSYGVIQVIYRRIYIRNKPLDENLYIPFYNGCILVCYGGYDNLFDMLDTELNIKIEVKSFEFI